MPTVKARKKEAFCSLLVCTQLQGLFGGLNVRSSKMELKYDECVIL